MKLKKTFSIVVPVYYNGVNLPETIPELLALADCLPDYQLELVFVDDGSGDDSLKILLDFQNRYHDIIQVVKLTRNFGEMAASQAGLLYSHGDCVGIIAADLQDPPELFVDMIEHWENGTKAIFAVRQDRDESFFKKLFPNIYYRLIRQLAIPGYPLGGFDFLLIDRQIVNEVNKIQEKNTNIMSLIFWLGYSSVLIPYVRRARKKGKSRWTLNKKFKLFVDTFVSFSYFPIRLFSIIGLGLALGAFLYGCLEVYYWWRFGIAVQGWVSIILILTITSGVQMAMLGIIGEYLWRTLEAARKRPSFVIDTVIPCKSLDDKDIINSHINTTVQE